MSIHGAKLLTLVLAAFCGLLLLLAFALQIGLGRGYTWLPEDVDAGSGSGASGIDRTAFKLPPEANFAETEAHPLFNEDRKPTPETTGDPVAPPPPAVPLNISLTGIILTPQLHMAMIQDKAKNATVALKEGMPMPGDLGGWTLTRINQRSAIFKETSGDEVEVELSTAVAGPSANATNRPGMPGRPGAKPPANSNPPQPNTANAQAEALQHRIEERRKQMRDEAERQKQQQHPPQH